MAPSFCPKKSVQSQNETQNETNEAPPVTITRDVYSAFLAMSVELPGFMQKKPILFVGIIMPFIDVILDFCSAGIV